MQRRSFRDYLGLLAIEEETPTHWRSSTVAIVRTLSPRSRRENGAAVVHGWRPTKRNGSAYRLAMISTPGLTTQRGPSQIQTNNYHVIGDGRPARSVIS